MSFGKYELGPLIAQGGMAEVYAARLHGAEGFVKTVAIKRILPHFTADPEFVRLFINEARLAAQLQHANIVQIHDFDEVEGTYYIAMELVQGRDLRRVLNRAAERGRRISIDLALHVVVEVLKGLAAAHELRDPEGQPVGLVHRDLSPHNILVSYAGEVKVTDFGIAKAVAPLQKHQVTTSNVIRGKLPYMSPEQLAGETLDRRSDLFSAGLILYELVTGRRRYDPEQAEEALILQVAKAEVPDPREQNAAVSPRLSDVIQTLLATRPEDRFDDARAALAALRDSGGAADRTLELAAFMRELFPEEAVQGSLSAVYFSADGEADGVAAEALPGERTPSRAAREEVDPGSAMGDSGVHGDSGVPRIPMGEVGTAGSAQAASGGVRRWGASTLAAARSPSNRPVVLAFLLLCLAGLGGAIALGWLGGTEAAAPADHRRVAQAKERYAEVGAAHAANVARPEAGAARAASVARPEAGRSDVSRAPAVLDVRSRPPGAAVFVDGLPTGRRTPARFGVPAGTHVIQARWPGGTTRTVTRRLAPQGIHRVELFRAGDRKGPRLAPARAVGRSAARASARRVVAAAAARVRSGAPRARLTAGTAPRPRGGGGQPVAGLPRSTTRRPGRPSWVEFICRPWALVRLGSRNLGQTPVRRRLPPGRYRVTFENANLALRVHRIVRVGGDGAPRFVSCQ